MKTPCRHPGCAALLDKSGYCPAHKASQPKRHAVYDRQIRHRDPALATAAKIRNSARWRKVRAQILSDFPLCADPFEDHASAGVTRSSSQVHHKRGLAEMPDLAFNRDNLQAVCTGCHARLEREVRATPKDERQPPPEPSSQEWCPFG